MRWQSVLTHGIVVSMLAGCGGGARDFTDAAATSTDPAAAAAAPTATASPSSLELAPNVPNVGSDGKSVVTVTATIKDANNVALQGQPVGFSTADAGATIAIKQGTTDASGRASAEVSVSNRSNRAVTVRATAGTLAATTAFEVIGTTVQVNGPQSAQVGTPVSFTATVRDAANAPLAGAAVTATSAKAVPVTLSAPTTNAQGQVVLRTTAPSGGDTITVSAAGAQATAGYTVSASDIAVLSPATGAQPEVGSPVAVQVRYRRDGAPVPNAALLLAATRGTLAAQSVVTDPSGIATTTLTSPLTGSSVITVTAPDGSVGEGRVEFVSSVAAKVELQPSPSVLGVNLAGTAPQNGTLIAVVRDASDNPVKGARVDFAAVRDPSSGSISPPFAFTDGAGVATTSFFAGPNATGPSEIVLRATVLGQTFQGAAIVDDASLTATRRELQVRIGTGSTVLVPPAPDDAVYNDLPYGVVVTDSAGNPARNVTVRAIVTGMRYRKGTWLRTGGLLPAWVERIDDTCPSEDVNRNLRIDAGEDLNRDGQLTPGNVASVFFVGAANPGEGVTDATGTVAMRVRYPRDRGNWTELLLRVTAAVSGGTEGATDATFFLPMRGTDLADPNATPPGTPSPYGTGPCP